MQLNYSLSCFLNSFSLSHRRRVLPPAFAKVIMSYLESISPWKLCQNAYGWISDCSWNKGGNKGYYGVFIRTIPAAVPWSWHTFAFFCFLLFANAVAGFNMLNKPLSSIPESKRKLSERLGHKVHPEWRKSSKVFRPAEGTVLLSPLRTEEEEAH